MVDWIKEDGKLEPGYEENLPEHLRSYAKGAKDIVSLIERGANTQREFHTRVKLPTELEDKRKFVAENFGDVLKSFDKERQAKADEEAQKAAQKAQEDRTTETEAAKQRVTDMLGTDAQARLELCRRAFRAEYCPSWIRELVAKAAEVEYDKLSDEKALEIIQTDPAIVQTLLAFGDLTKDGHTVHGPGYKDDTKDKMQKPGYPDAPVLYRNRPDTDPEKQWFIAHGVDFEEMTWNGKPID